MTIQARLTPIVLLGGLTLPYQLWAADQSATATLFERDVVPIFSVRCFKCHGLEARKAGLDLRTPPMVFHGSDKGPVLVKGSAEQSMLFQRVASGAMPPGDEKKLTPQELETVRHWIDGGAQFARRYGSVNQAEARPVTEKDREFWSFRKPVRAEVPKVRQVRRVRTPIDTFLLAKLEEKGLGFSQEADRISLIRRSTFDLTGLPPTPEQVDAFVADKSPRAWEHLVDQLLASPHFGEKWARHWLDAAGYVDAMGLDHVVGNIVYGDGKWRYRDYVVSAFNTDKAYDRFLTEQLAGDEIVDWRSLRKFTPETQRLLTATGFLRTASDDTDIPEVNTADIRYTLVQTMIRNISTNLLGLTVGCAQCHSHKYDPIPQQDYYRFMAVFAPAYNVQSWLAPKDRMLPDVSIADKEEIDRFNAEIDKEIAPLKKQVADLRRPHEDRLLDQRLESLPEPVRADLKAALKTEDKKRTPVEKYLVAKLGPLTKVKDEEVLASMSDSENTQVRKVEDQIRPFNEKRRSYGHLQALYDVGEPPPSYLFRRGGFDNPVAEVEPGFLSILTEVGKPAIIPASAPGAKTSGRRLALARWLTDPDTPAGGLAARVFVNRVWMHLFGEGIVPTVDNFGRSGMPPVNPELLDWLATDFMSSGWRIKPLIRLMMMSSAYQQASWGGPAIETATAESVDPGNRLLWHARLRRLESEDIRDAVLATSGKLDLTMGGKPVPLDYEADGMVQVAKKDLPTPTSQWRRSLYLFTRRNYNLSLLIAFDQPVMNGNCPRRTTSSVVLQSLAMLNDSFILEQAEYFANRLNEAHDLPAKIDQAFRIALARKPTPKELAWSADLIRRHSVTYAATGMVSEKADSQGLVQLCRMLLNTNEFLYLE
jgi:hypothetical protein